MSIQLNSKQEQVFDQLKKFVDDPIHNTFILNGYAGTGKTFLMQYFAAYLQKKKIKFELLASTGRAASVLRGKTDFAASTIHSALYKFAEVMGDDDSIPDGAPPDAYGQMTLRFEAVGRLSEDCIYIVDESSMIASESTDSNSFAYFGSGCLLPDLLRAVDKNKIIFVGDPAQLPPVFQLHSPALDKDWLKQQGRKVLTATLDEIMRTDDDNDILEIASAIRKQIGVVPYSMWIKMPALGKKIAMFCLNQTRYSWNIFQNFSNSDPKNVSLLPTAIKHATNSTDNSDKDYFLQIRI